jgi:hypothetical protein
MKKLVVLLLASLVATSAFAVIDEDPNSMGIYFDRTADENCLTTGASVPFFTYLILTNPTPQAVNAYELGLEVVVPAGMEGMFFQLASNIADGAVSGINVGSPTALGGDYIVGLAGPIPAQPATILHSWQHMLLAVIPVEYYIGASSAPSLPGDFPVAQDADGSILFSCGQSTGGPDVPVAVVNGAGPCPVGVEETSFGSVKSLFR